MEKDTEHINYADLRRFLENLRNNELLDLKGKIDEVVEDVYKIISGDNLSFATIDDVDSLWDAIIPDFPETSRKVMFMDYDGTVISQKDYIDDASIEYPNDPERDGYRFMKWTRTETRNSIVFTATYREVLVVAFVDYDNELIVKVPVLMGDTVEAPTNPTREGYTFIGWDKPFDAILHDETYTAQYEANSYKLSFVMNGSTVENTIKCDDPVTIEIPNIVNKEYYITVGWDSEVPSIMPAHDVTLTAIYEKWEGQSLTEGDYYLMNVSTGKFLTASRGQSASNGNYRLRGEMGLNNPSLFHVGFNSDGSGTSFAVTNDDTNYMVVYSGTVNNNVYFSPASALTATYLGKSVDLYNTITEQTIGLDTTYLTGRTYCIRSKKDNTNNYLNWNDTDVQCATKKSSTTSDVWMLISKDDYTRLKDKYATTIGE